MISDRVSKHLQNIFIAVPNKKKHNQNKLYTLWRWNLAPVTDVFIFYFKVNNVSTSQKKLSFFSQLRFIKLHYFAWMNEFSELKGKSSIINNYYKNPFFAQLLLILLIKWMSRCFASLQCWPLIKAYTKAVKTMYVANAKTKRL